MKKQLGAKVWIFAVLAGVAVLIFFIYSKGNRLLKEEKVKVEKKLGIIFDRELSLKPNYLLKQAIIIEDLNIMDPGDKELALGRIDHLKIKSNAINLITHKGGLVLKDARVLISHVLLAKMLMKKVKPPTSPINRPFYRNRRLPHFPKGNAQPPERDLDKLQILNGNIRISDIDSPPPVIFLKGINMVLRKKQPPDIRYNILEGDIDIREIESKDKLVGSLSAHCILDLHKGELIFQELSLSVSDYFFGGGTVKGNLKIDLWAFVLDFDLDFNNIDYFSFIKVFYPSLETYSHSRLNGDIQMRFTMHGLTPSNLSGLGAITLTDGYFSNVPISSEVINYYKLDVPLFALGSGMYFDHLATDILIDEDYFSLNSITLSSEYFKLRGRGQIWYKNEMDFFLYVTPNRKLLQNRGNIYHSDLPIMLRGKVGCPDLSVRH